MRLLFTILLFIFSLTLAAQNPKKDSNLFQTAGYVVKTSFTTIPSDFVFLGKEFSDDWKKTGYYATGILGLIATDKITTKAWQNYVEPNIDYRLPNITPNFLTKGKNKWIKGSNSYLTYPIIGLYFGSLLGNNEKGQFAAVNSFKALAYSTLVTQIALKSIFGRNRPFRPLNSQFVDGRQNVNPNEWTNNNWDFFNGRRNTILFSDPTGTALPSMHVTAYFALAKVIQMEYDNYWVPYGVMTAVFFHNVKSHNHWISDMVVGGLIGTLIGRSVVRSSWKARGILPQNKQRSISLNYIPQVSSDFTGLRIIANIE
tara:strand:- start:9466 stop:10407 length:942 start_codon:yes stop_codon:yes gene_type:complete